jgi:hypothetical protein
MIKASVYAPFSSAVFLEPPPPRQRQRQHRRMCCTPDSPLEAEPVAVVESKRPPAAAAAAATATTGPESAAAASLDKPGYAEALRAADVGAVWSAKRCWLVYRFRSGRRQYAEFYERTAPASHTPVSEMHRHVCVGWVATELAADTLIDALIADDRASERDDVFAAHELRTRLLPLGPAQLDRFERAHIAGSPTAPADHPRGHVSLGDAGECADCRRRPH